MLTIFKIVAFTILQIFQILAENIGVEPIKRSNTLLSLQLFFNYTLCVILSGEGWIRTNYLHFNIVILTEVTLIITIVSEEIRQSVFEFLPRIIFFIVENI